MNTNTDGTQILQPVKQKRGRKSKKELQAIQEQKEKESQEINFSLKEQNDCAGDDNNNSNIENNEEKDLKQAILETTEENTVVKPPPKKRGRKPKGGKIVQQSVQENSIKQEKPNIILSLKCTIKDIMQNNNAGFTIMNQQNNGCNEFEGFNKGDIGYEILDYNNTNNTNINNNNNNGQGVTNNNFFYEETTDIKTLNTNFNNIISNVNVNKEISNKNTTQCIVDYDDEYESTNKSNEIREIWRKLKQLEHNLHTNNLSDKKSACFWCTCDFDNPPVYVPKHYIKDSYHVYGCFCSPECATAYLMEENIDSSVKFERYHLLNHIYSKIYNYTKNIKPAPNPYYMLNKFYGNLSIQEYRALLKNERLFLIVDKPLTRVLPELHEDNDDFILNNKVIPSNGYQIKKNTHKKPQTKSSLLTEKFGLTAAM